MKTTHGGFPRWRVPQQWMVYIGNSYSNLAGGIPTSLKNDGVSNSWHDEIPKMMGKS